jgi:hypothetical protein
MEYTGRVTLPSPLLPVKKILFPLLLLCVLPARAEWNLLYKQNESSLYIDPLTVVRGTRPRVWGLHDYGKPDEYQDQSARLLFESNCYDGTLRKRSAVYYKDPMARGDTTSEYQPTPWEVPAADTLEAAALYFLCGKKP